MKTPERVLSDADGDKRVSAARYRRDTDGVPPWISAAVPA